MTEDTYPFVGGDPIEQRHTYAYIPFRGARFVDEWRESRAKTKARLGAAAPGVPEAARTEVPGIPEVQTREVLEYLMHSLDVAQLTADTDAWIKWCIERFEVSKRVFSIYSFEGERARGRNGYQDLGLYLRLAEVLAKSFQVEGRLPALNALVKCMDILCSHAGRLSAVEKSRLARLITLEGSCIDDLTEGRGGELPRSRTGVPTEPNSLPRQVRRSSANQGEKGLDDAVLLVADTVRSRGYAQALLAEGFALRAVLVIRSAGELRWGQAENIPAPPAASYFPDLFVPDLRVPLEKTCERLSDCVEFIETGSINAEEVRTRLAELSPSLVIYSGFGGELVQPDILKAAGPFLHMHAGWLPEYRGSTTIYYSLLREGACGVSAILLTPKIDAGEILLRRWYSPPSVDVDLDYYYDSIIRSDVLVQTLARTTREGRIPEGKVQDPSDGEIYYIIHPVLKHIAILSLSGNDRACGSH